MTEPLRVNPEYLTKTSENLTDVSGQVKSLLSSLKSTLSNEGEPWGDDETGHSFADGPDGNDGYVAQRDGVFDSIDAKAQLLDMYAAQLKNFANATQQQDQG